MVQWAMPRGHRPTTRGAVALAALALTATACFNATAPPERTAKPGASARTTPATVPADFMGMHATCVGTKSTPPCATTKGAWPTVPVGSYRIWGVRESWAQISRSKGAYNWGPLDLRVAMAIRQRTQPVYVLGSTPTWASARPADSNSDGAGAAAEPADLADWKDFVSALATRYKGKIGAYEIWNEPDRAAQFTGTPEKMAELTKVAHDAIKAADPEALVVSPGVQVRDKGAADWLKAYFAAGAGDDVDAVGVHLDPFATQAPEALLALATTARAQLEGTSASTKPLWNTSMSFGRSPRLGAADKAVEIGGADGIGFPARASLMSLQSKVARAFWFAWDDRSTVGLYLTDAQGKPTQAGTAYGQTYRWLVGSAFRGCSKNGPQWTCTVSYPQRDGIIMWSEGKDSPAKVPSGALCLRTLGGGVQANPRATLSLTGSPILLVTPGGTRSTQKGVPGTLSVGDPCKA